jgi:hypothetical protein
MDSGSVSNWQAAAPERRAIVVEPRAVQAMRGDGGALPSRWTGHRRHTGWWISVDGGGGLLSWLELGFVCDGDDLSRLIRL